MRTTCINHPAKEPLLIIRRWQLEACDGDHCAAGLLSFFEYWHNIKLEQARKAGQENDVAERHGDGRAQNESLVQWHNSEELQQGLLGLYSHGKIADAIKLLESKGFLRTFRNPNPRYKFDATKHFVFDDDKVNEWLAARSSKTGESIARKAETAARKAETAARNRQTVDRNGKMTIEAETSSEFTAENKEAKAACAAPASPAPVKTNGRKQNGIVALDEILSMLPGPLNTPGVRAALADFAESRKALKVPLTPGAAKRTLDDLAGFTALEAEAALGESVKRGWRGVFPRKLATAKPASDDLIPSDQLTDAQKAENAKNGEDWKNNLW